MQSYKDMEYENTKKYILVTTVSNVQIVDWRTRDGKNLRTFTKTWQRKGQNRKKRQKQLHTFKLKE